MEEKLTAGMIIGEGERLRLRVAGIDDLDFIIAIQKAEDNRDYVVFFDEEFHESILTMGEASIDVIVEEKASGERVGYFLVAGLKSPAKKMEWTHVIIAKKGLGYGHEAMKLMKKWAFDTLGFHRVWLDCKEYNSRALHLYESEGMVREGIFRDTILFNGVYENLVVLAILEDEYRARKERGLELN